MIGSDRCAGPYGGVSDDDNLRIEHRRRAVGAGVETMRTMRHGESRTTGNKLGAVGTSGKLAAVGLGCGGRWRWIDNPADDDWRFQRVFLRGCLMILRCETTYG